MQQLTQWDDGSVIIITIIIPMPKGKGCWWKSSFFLSSYIPFSGGVEDWIGLRPLLLPTIKSVWPSTRGKAQRHRRGPVSLARQGEARQGLSFDCVFHRVASLIRFCSSCTERKKERKKESVFLLLLTQSVNRLPWRRRRRLPNHVGKQQQRELIRSPLSWSAHKGENRRRKYTIRGGK